MSVRLLDFPLAKNVGALRSSIDMLVVTATEVERDAVLHRLAPLEGRDSILKGPVGKATYFLGSLGAHGAALVMCRMGGTGAGAARDAVAEGCANWMPRAVVMVGIAFGKDPVKQKLGDVLVSTQIISYEEQRVGAKREFRGPTAETSPVLLDRFRNVVGWSYPRGDGTACVARIGPILSGEKLIANAAFKATLLRHFPTAIGGEMEGRGLYTAASEAGVGWILVKGICDWGDETKHDGAHALAAAAAVDLVWVALSGEGALEGLPEKRGTIAQDSSTPRATLVGTPIGQTTYLTSDAVHLPLWRRVPVRDELRFNPPREGFDDGDNGTRVFQLGPAASEFFLGRKAPRGGTRNALVLPHGSVSRQCLRVTIREGRTVLRLLAECSAPVTVGMYPLEPGEERAIYHGQPISIGHISGIFVDGRYAQPQVSSHAIDPVTGLLGREGIAWEIALAIRQGEEPQLLLVQPKVEGDVRELTACRVALAIHAALPSQPVARLDTCVVVALTGLEPLGSLVDVAQRAAGAPVVAGHYRIGAAASETAAREAAARVEEARAALDRACALSAPDVVLDLNQHTPALVDDLPRFEREASALLACGGELVLMALADRERLDQLGPGVCDALELEVLEMLCRASGPDTLLARPLPGIVTCAAPGAVGQVARDMAAGWRALGPVRGDKIEVERDLCIEVVRAPEAPDLRRRAVDLASGSTLRVEALPAPLALRVRAALNATSLLEEATTLVDLVRETFRFAAVTLTSMLARSAKGAAPWIASEKDWRGHATHAAAALAGTPERVGALVSAWFDPQGTPRGGLAVAADLASVLERALERRPIDRAVLHREQQAVRQALDALVTDLRALRGWTLVAIDRVDKLDTDRDAVTVSYIDYTGTVDMGAPRRVTLLSDRWPSPLVYLSRFAEGIVVPLDPFVRRKPCPECGLEELFWAEDLISAPGRHRYRSVHRAHELTDDVRLKELPAPLRGTGG